MKSFTALIDKESEKALRELAKSQVQFLFSPSADLNYGSSLITVQNVSIQIGPKRFVIIENDWADTPKEWHDYYILKARISDQPKDIKVNESENGKRNSGDIILNLQSFIIAKLNFSNLHICQYQNNDKRHTKCYARGYEAYQLECR